MQNRKDSSRHKIDLLNTIKETLSEVQDRLVKLALKEEKDIDGKEIFILSECDKKLRLMDDSIFDKDASDSKKELVQCIRKLEERYFPKLPDFFEEASGASDIEADEDILYSDLGAMDGLCDLEAVTDSDDLLGAEYDEQNENCQPEMTLNRIESGVFKSGKSSLVTCSHFSSNKVEKESDLELANLAEQHGILILGAKC